MSQSYDYIIIGAGSAGCVLANRLSADPDTTVLLLEAGKDDNNPLIHMPAGINELVPGKKFNWHFWTKPDPNMGDRPMFWPRGKGLGGSSSINAMIYIRGHASDYDQWRQMGNEGWGFDDVLPYFKKAEHYEGGEDAFHGINGPLNVTRTHFPDELSETYIKASVEAGHKAADDFNGTDQEGVGYYDFTIKKGNRNSAAQAYLHPVKKRKNLTVLTECHTLKIITEGKRATGVEYADGTRVKVKAKKEVIVSAGAVNSPQILLLSGIGPADEIKEHGIDVVHDLKGVGKNLQ
ncbi:MAG: GMC family oxidoreductase N-terminal domain-containing protein, partial [Sphingomonadales bacterium]|nr:GMC family oxidoreductase N-terminal domain-containing protein [Sphingomonadales bacterium]